MGRSFFAAIFFLGLICLAGQPAQAGRRVWSGIVMATNAPRPHAPPPEIHRFDGTLRRTFGYNQFEVIGQSRKELRKGEQNWLARTKHFAVHVDARGARSDGYRLNLQLFQDRQVLLETDTALSKSSPLVIRGPQVGAGQLLLLLEVQ